MSADLPQLNWDFVSMMKNELKEASGAPETEQMFQKKYQLPYSNLEAIMEIPQIQSSKSPLQTNPNEKNSSLLNWLNLSPPTSTNPLSPRLNNHLRWLLRCHKLWQLPLELQQAYWPELLELEYPAEMEQEQPVIFDNDYKFQIMEEEEVEAMLLEILIKEKGWTLLEIPVAEILEEVEEGEIPQILMQQG